MENITSQIFLDKFINMPVYFLSYFLCDNGWKVVPCFNDYKWVWVNESINKSIIAKVEMVDDDFPFIELIYSIWAIDHVYSE